MEIPLKYTLAAAAVTALVACGGGGDGVTPAAPYNYSQHNGAYSCLPINQQTSPANYSSVVFTDRSVTFSNNGVELLVINQNVGITPAGKPYYSMPYTSNKGIDYSLTAYIDNNQLKIIIGPSLNVPNNLSELSDGTGILCEKTLPPG